MDVASVDVIWNGFAQSLKIAALAETHEVACAPHNYYSHLATFIAAQWCAAIPNVRLLEIDVDDVPWREELTTAVPEIRDGELIVPGGPGLGLRRRRGRPARAPGAELSFARGRPPPAVRVALVLLGWALERRQSPGRRRRSSSPPAGSFCFRGSRASSARSRSGSRSSRRSGSRPSRSSSPPRRSSACGSATSRSRSSHPVSSSRSPAFCVARPPPREADPSPPRRELLTLLALAGIVAFALASSWDVAYPFQARGTDWGHPLLYGSCRRPGLHRSRSAGAGTGGERAEPRREPAGKAFVAQPQLEAGELPELVHDGVGDPAPPPGPQSHASSSRRYRAPARRRAARDASPSTYACSAEHPSRRSAGTPSHRVRVRVRTAGARPVDAARSRRAARRDHSWSSLIAGRRERGAVERGARDRGRRRSRTASSRTLAPRPARAADARLRPYMKSRKNPRAAGVGWGAGVRTRPRRPARSARPPRAARASARRPRPRPGGEDEQVAEREPTPRLRVARPRTPRSGSPGRPRRPRARPRCRRSTRVDGDDRPLVDVLPASRRGSGRGRSRRS